MKIFTKKNILFAVAFVAINFILSIIFGLAFMQYEDFYIESNGPYYSLESMTNWDKIFHFGFYIWIGVNCLIIIYIIYKSAIRLIK